MPFSSGVSRSIPRREKQAAGSLWIRIEIMEMHQNTVSLAQTPPPNGLASLILRNVFGNGNGNNATSRSDTDAQLTDEPKLVDATEIIARLDCRKEKASVALRIDASEVETLPFDLSKLESEGVFMNIDCRGFSSLVRQLEWKTLGVKLPEDAAVRISPPRAGLLPDVYRNKFMRGAAQAHNALNRYGFRFTLCETVWGTSEYKWVPWTAFEQFEGAYLHACETLAKAKAEVLEKYDEILTILQDSFYRLAEDSADRFQATTDEPFDRAEFTNAVAAQAIGMVPTPEMIRDGLTIEMKPKVIVLGSEMAAEQKLTRELRLEAARAEAETRTIEIEVEAKASIERLKVTGFEEDQRREREVKERIRLMKIEAARREAEEAVSPIKEGLAQITARICEAAQEMSERLQDARFVPGSLAKRARQMCEWYSLMNFTGDDSLEDVLVKLQEAAGREAKQRSPEEMRNALNDILRATTVQSRKLLDEDRLSALEL